MSGTIIYVGNFELPDKNAAAHRVLNNAKLFGELGCRTVFLGTCRGEYFDGVVRRRYDTGFDIFEQAYPDTTARWAKSIFDVKNIRELIKKYPDTSAVILYNTQYATLLAVRRALGNSGIKLIYDCTEWNGFTEGNYIKRLSKSLDSRLIEDRLPSACDGIIAVSKTMYDRYRVKMNTLLLPPLVDTADPIWRQPPAENEKFTFLYAGSPSDKDRLDILINAFARLPDGSSALKIVGVYKNEYAGAIIPENVCFAGRLSHTETVREMLGCGAFVFLREMTRRNTAGFPTKFAEAYTCGVPIITTDVSDIRDHPADDLTVLPVLSEETVLGAMRGVLSGKGGSRQIRDAFDYRKKINECNEFLIKMTSDT